MTKKKILTILPFHRVAALIVLMLLILLSAKGFLSAEVVIQGYDADGPLQKGMLVRVKDSDTTKIEPVSNETADRLHGVVVDANDAAVTLSTEGQKVFVATAGKHEVLVSDQNGALKTGEYITPSSVSGIGMRADGKQLVVAGKALEGFDGKSNVVSSTNVGGRTVNIGRVQADIAVMHNPLQQPAGNVPGFLRRSSDSIAGKSVSTPRIYMSLAVFLASTLTAASLLYSAARNAIISVGRNPLGKKSIIRSMMQVVLVSLAVFLSGLFGVYLLLRL